MLPQWQRVISLYKKYHGLAFGGNKAAESEQLFYKAFNANPLSMTIVSVENNIFIEVNEAFAKRNGYTKEELIGNKVTDFNFFVDLTKYVDFQDEINRKGFIEDFEIEFRKKSGEVVIVLIAACVITWKGQECILAIANDITERRLYQKELARLDRLDVIGQMAASISHEIRNPMTTVKGFLQLFREKDRYEEDRRFIDLMIEEMDRANSIRGGLEKNYSRLYSLAEGRD